MDNTPREPKRTDDYDHRTGGAASIFPIFPLQQNHQRKRGPVGPFSCQVSVLLGI
jgi:hypothetical protein